MLQDTGTRETRPTARELKFRVPLATADRIVAWSRGHLSHDPHGTGPFRDEYQTTSLYFDTSALDVYYRKGSFGRSKYRIRRYDAAPIAFLERKLRTKSALTKRRTPIELEGLRRLAGNGSNGPWSGSWFQQRLEMRHLRPTCQITYRRVARLVTTFDGPARLTVDCGVLARPALTDQFVPEAADGTRVLSGDAIVELKFLGQPPAMFRELVEIFAIEPTTISKYRLSIEALARAGDVPASLLAVTKASNVVDA
jgi:hypothetical protein